MTEQVKEKQAVYSSEEYILDEKRSHDFNKLYRDSSGRLRYEEMFDNRGHIEYSRNFDEHGRWHGEQNYYNERGQLHCINTYRHGVCHGYTLNIWREGKEEKREESYFWQDKKVPKLLYEILENVDLMLQERSWKQAFVLLNPLVKLHDRSKPTL